MTRDSLPRFDLYGELEVSPSASVGDIESAYRSLVKQHHPDVAAGGDAPGDDARIKRLNLAREWLTDPDRRRRYDATRPELRRAGRGPDPSAESPVQSFGVNAAEVRHFLGELRGLDRYRARQVWDGRAVAHAKGYTRARRAAATIGRANRHDEWLFAREAASVIARGELGDSVLTEQILDVVADVAGAIVIRDLLPRRDYDVLLLPWRWRGEPVSVRPPVSPGAPMPAVRVGAARPSSAEATDVPAPVATAVAVSLATAAAAPPAVPRMESAITTANSASRARAAAVEMADARLRQAIARARPRRSSLLWPAVAVLAVAAILGGVVGTLTRPRPNQAIAGITDAPGDTSGVQSDGSLQPSPASTTDDPTQPGATGLGPAATGVGGPLPTPNPPGSGGGGGGSTPTPGPGATPGGSLSPSVPPGSTPTPTLPPGPTPTPNPTPPPPPTPTPGPTPTPAGFCEVISLIGVNTNNAQSTWNNAGFSGTVLFSPAVPPPFVIQWQSLAIGSSVTCTSWISVMKQAP